jgi:hypothetical protein
MEIKTNILSLLRSSSYSASGTCRVTRVNNTILHHVFQGNSNSIVHGAVNRWIFEW